MFCVYLIQSTNFPKQRYIGYTSDLKKRLDDHNRGYSFHTSKYKPWHLIAYVAFNDEHAATVFEQYLKTGSVQAFANRHLWK